MAKFWISTEISSQNSATESEFLVRRCVATKLSEQSVVQFCMWRWHYRSLGSGKVVTKPSNMTHTHTHTHARTHGRKNTEHLTALWFFNASLGCFLLSFLLICEICRVFLVPIFLAEGSTCLDMRNPSKFFFLKLQPSPDTIVCFMRRPGARATERQCMPANTKW